MRHRKLVQLMGVCTTEPMYIVTEYMSNGCLRDYLMKDGSKDMPFIDLMSIAAQVMFIINEETDLIIWCLYTAYPCLPSSDKYVM